MGIERMTNAPFVALSPTTPSRLCQMHTSCYYYDHYRLVPLISKNPPTRADEILNTLKQRLGVTRVTLHQLKALFRRLSLKS
eukprot:snap_masked-scaffold_34-processed-gene-3.32-mRNA-1 protein AED:1.00 eAED:1.00 QI:0/0/0/0/1/1/2/0/81